MRVLRMPSRWPAAILDSLRHAGAGLLWLVVLPWNHRAVVLHVSSILGGWGLLTWGIATLLDWLAGPESIRVVWLLSGGLLLLSFAGWGHLRRLFGPGLYELKRRAQQAEEFREELREEMRL